MIWGRVFAQREHILQNQQYFLALCSKLSAVVSHPLPFSSLGLEKSARSKIWFFFHLILLISKVHWLHEVKRNKKKHQSYYSICPFPSQNSPLHEWSDLHCSCTGRYVVTPGTSINYCSFQKGSFQPAKWQVGGFLEGFAREELNSEISSLNVISTSERKKWKDSFNVIRA